MAAISAASRSSWFPFLALALLLFEHAPAEETDPSLFTIARLQYDGGGDWYSDPSSLPNLLDFLRQQTSIEVAAEPVHIRILDEELFSFPYLYLTGHGNISFSPDEIVRLRHFLESGGFLHADDNYGMDESFRRELRKLFPKKELVELPPDHGIFHCHFEFPAGLPKIHEHDGGRPEALGLFHEGRLVVFYNFNSDIGDGWDDPEVHGDPPEKRSAALRMGTNVVVWALSH